MQAVLELELADDFNDFMTSVGVRISLLHFEVFC